MSSTSYTDGDWTYTLDEDDNATITAYNGTDTDLTFPSTVGTDYTVVAIGTEGGMDYTSRATIVSAHIPDTVTTLNSTFYECSALESVDLPAGLTTIGGYTFNFCHSLASITIPRTVTSVSDYAFDECYSLTSITFLSGTAPTFGSDALTLGTSAHSAECTVYSTGNWASGALDSYINQYTTLTYEPYVVTYRPLTYEDAKIQVESAIRDGNGARIDTNYQKKPQVIEYTVPTTVETGGKVIAEYNGTYDGSPGYVKFAIEVTSSSYIGVHVAEATWGQTQGGITLLSSNSMFADTTFLYVYYPQNSAFSSHPPLLAVRNNSTREKQVKITVIESSGNLTWKTDWDTAAPSSGWSTQYVDLSKSSHVSYATNATYATSANSTATSSSSVYSYQTRNRVFRVGETDTNNLMAIDHTGIAYKINTSTKKFPLPITMYLGDGSNANYTSYNRQLTTAYGTGSSRTYVSNLTSSSYNDFTMPTLTASDGGKTLYVRGSLDADGYFVCDGNVTLSMEAGYTYIPFGTLDPNYSGTTAQAPTSYSLNVISIPAYTLDANGKLTHIDGKQIAPKVTVSDQAPSGGSDGDIWIQY